ncbi:MAG TPA: tetratricopeptide repeat protein [Longimicrobiales bacterium]|nr:tetratricopeptide repeat protein [Longimicrobiales bacterium]
MSANRGLVLVLAVAAAVSCRPDDQRTETMDPQEAIQKREDLDPRVVHHLDSGSVLFRNDDHQGALREYRAATEIDPNAAAAWFGVYMAEHALGNEEAAQEALQRARSTVPGATLIHPTRGDTLR